MRFATFPLMAQNLHDSACVEKRGGTTGVLNRRADDRRGEKRETETRVLMSKETQGHGASAQKTQTDTKTERHEYVYILTNDKYTNRIGDRLQPIRPAVKNRGIDSVQRIR